MASWVIPFLASAQSVGQRPDPLLLKAPSASIQEYGLFTGDKGEQDISYSYKTGIVAVEEKEIISKRTENSQTFQREPKHFETKFFSGNQFVLEGDTWYGVDYATTTLKAWNEQFKPVSYFFTSPALASTYYSTTGDGGVYYTNATWSTAHDATTGSGRRTGTVDYPSCGPDFTIERGFVNIDTSALGADAVIDSAKLYFHEGGDIAYPINDSYAYVGLTQSTQADPTSPPELGDYGSVGSTQGADTIMLDALAGNAYNCLTLNATGISWINLTGWTSLALREGHDITNNACSGASDNHFTLNTGAYTGTDHDPYLDITWHTGGGPGPEPEIGTSTPSTDDIGYIFYTATSTGGIYYVPFLYYFFVVISLAFTILVCWFFYYLIYRKKTKL